MTDYTANISISNWPKLNEEELIKFYNEIKANKIIDLSWKNPGRIDPKIYKENVEISKENESIKDENDQMNTESENLIKNDEFLVSEFDLFDEFNNDMEKNSNEVLKLTHTKTREADKKVASMDKILDDIRKKLEYEQKNQIITSNKNTDEYLLHLNKDFETKFDEDQVSNSE